jgi:hypothetical protein
MTNSLKPVTMRPVIKEAKSTNEKYRARWRPDCPGATGDPGRTVKAEGYVRMQKDWTQSNYVGGSQGRHGDVPKTSEGYGERRTSGGGY